MKLIINSFNLKDEDIEEHNIKVRAILINDNNKILVGNYGGTYLLPGGSINPNEDIPTCLIRELKEETGIEYKEEELISICNLDYYQKNYPKRNGTIKNRLITTYYYLSTYKETSTNQTLTEREQKDNFKLELIPIKKLRNIIKNNKNNNPRSIYFQKELLIIIKFYKKSKYYKNNKKKILIQKNMYNI